MSSPVPNLPPISGIQDPQVRAYLQALTNAWLVRNGQIGDGQEKFLTVKDLQDGIAMAARGGAGGGSIGGGSAGSKPIANLIQGLADQIMQTRLWKLLGERIEKIEMPEWFKGKFGAEIRVEQIKQQNATNALAEQVTTAITNINNNVAIAQQTLKAVSDTAGASASAITNLQVTVNGTREGGGLVAKAQEALTLAQSVDGTVKGAWTVKFELGDDGKTYVAGVGLGVTKGVGGEVTSDFIVRADRFAIGTPANYADMENADVPFIVTTIPTMIDGVTYPPGMWVKTSFIADATIGTAKIEDAAITNAQIKDLAVDTLKIAGHAVTFPLGVTGSGATLPTSNIVLTETTQVMVIVMCNWLAYDGSVANGHLQAKCGDQLGIGVGISMPGGYSGSATAFGVFDMPAGTHACTMEQSVDGGGGRNIGATSVFAVALKR